MAMIGEMPDVDMQLHFPLWGTHARLSCGRPKTSWPELVGGYQFTATGQALMHTCHSS